MPGSRPSYCRLRCFVSLIVLIANVAAPFRTPTGRSLIRCPRQSDTTRSVARVRVVSHPGAVNGFRAVVGFAKGNSGEAAHSRDTRPVSTIPPSSAPTGNGWLLNPTTSLPLPRLRC